LGHETVNKIIRGFKEDMPENVPVKEVLLHSEALYCSFIVALGNHKAAKEKGFVSMKEFEKNIEQQPHFLGVLNQGLVSSASQADMEALVYHSKCFNA
jgi:hypothetical protein